MTFKDAVKNHNNGAVVRTENGMKSNATSSSAVLDFFGKVGSSRGVDMTQPFFSAYGENSDLTLRTLLWTRDVRGGAGEREQFRKLLSALEATNPSAAASIMHKVPFVGRWDDLFAYKEKSNRDNAFRMIGDALRDGNGLCAKWMPRKGSVAVELRNALGMTPKQYRKTLVNLTNVVETQMCAKKWNEINFSNVPSLASARYQKAFGRNAGTAYAKYLAELQKPQSQRDPKVKINAGAVYPYDITKSVSHGNAAVADEQWKALPNYIGNAKILPMVDVSASMTWSNISSGLSPMEVAVSLGLYTSEKNTSDFKDMFLTFSGRPEILELKGSLSTRINQMVCSNWGRNTDLHKAFDLVLNVAKNGDVPQSDMPDMILILSDMQFDSCTRFDDSAKQMIERKYRNAGYTMPKIVFWNLNAGYGNDSPVKFNDQGVAMVTGFSPAIMKSVLANDLEDFTPYRVMEKTIMNERYDYRR